MNEKEIFSKRLTKLIKSSHKSMNQIERELGYPRNALFNYRQGNNPSAVRLLDLSAYFGVTPEYLMGREGEDLVKSSQVIFQGLSDSQKEEMCMLCYDWLLLRNK
ncbi:helix-turn-helix domain-containing protein [Lactococcus lactis]|uniref:helix-turn-helix domain-containing protein n=1 Tax=Lactococcus lactis TaxID=1358 RepID=UPI0022E1EABD|nr:helix-turn-helix transcriptional regulator [Lactococcus lactis]